MIFRLPCRCTSLGKSVVQLEMRLAGEERKRGEVQRALGELEDTRLGLEYQQSLTAAANSDALEDNSDKAQVRHWASSTSSAVQYSTMQYITLLYSRWASPSTPLGTPLGLEYQQCLTAAAISDALEDNSDKAQVRLRKARERESTGMPLEDLSEEAHVRVEPPCCG